MSAPAQPTASDVRSHLGGTQILKEFLKTTGKLTENQRDEIIDQALVLIEGFFVHLPLKRAMHAIDPVQRLKLLKKRHLLLSERAFHDEMISIFTHLRDLHTSYVLPDPFRTRTAFVPFRLEEFRSGENGEVRCYVVTQVSPLVNDPHFLPGVEVTHWNEIPIDRAVELNAEREAGGNVDARRARGLDALTVRWMGISQPPDEERVTVRYLAAGQEREILFNWQVTEPGSPLTGMDVTSEGGPLAHAFGIDAKAECERRIRKLLFAPQSIDLERTMASVGGRALNAPDRGASLGVDLGQDSTLPDVFKKFEAVQTTFGTFGYLRITSFNVTDDQTFVSEFVRLVEQLPQEGLILDVRGNPGGLIPAGERLLQTLTPHPIEPCRLHFLNTLLTRQLCQRDSSVQQWEPSINMAIETGEIFSQGFPLYPEERYNDIGQKYQGPVVLITDALCYSTTDIFAAGFQDHGIGKILGVSGNTGAGGANVWAHDYLRSKMGEDSPLKPLPRRASFQVAIRRTTRVGPRQGVPLEDIGVIPDDFHHMTRRDVLEGNPDLIEKAASLLDKTVYALRAEVTGLRGSSARIRATAIRNVTRIDALVDGRPRKTLDVKDGSRSFEVPGAKGGRILELRGFQNGELVASTRLSL